MRNLIPVLFAPILLAALSFGSTQEGTVGAPDSQIVVQRTLAGSPGVTITAQRGGTLLVASSEPWGGTEEAALPPTVVTTSWTSGGIRFEVTITQGPNESIPDFTRRVDSTVRALQNVRPRDGAATGEAGNHP